MRRRWRGTEAQILPLLGILLFLIIAGTGLAVDVGRMYMAHAELSRALDAAALAGVAEIDPDLPDHGVAAAQAKARAYFLENLPSGTITFPASGQNEFRVAGSRSVGTTFMKVFGVGTASMKGDATAAAGATEFIETDPRDVVLTIDTTGSMDGSPLNNAKDAAINFTNILLPASATWDLTKVGVVPYRGCFNPPRSNNSCVDAQDPGSLVEPLGSDGAAVTSAIQSLYAVSGTGTNNCWALLKSKDVLWGAGHHTEEGTSRYVVILSDGDNTYNSAAYSASPQSPPTDCRPASGYTSSDSDTGTSCRATQTKEGSLDTKTYAMAQTLKKGPDGVVGTADDVEVYVVGFGVCGSPSATLCDTSIIGPVCPSGSVGRNGHCKSPYTNRDDNYADRNILKCIASSTPGTNDHYFEVQDPDDLPAVFQEIAELIYPMRLIR